MKQYSSPLATLLLFFAFVACTPENNNGENGDIQNNPDELIITGESLDITDHTAKLTGYANLPFELGDAEVGIVYDKAKSFEDARNTVASGLDGNNMFTVTVTGLEPSTTYYYKSYVRNGIAIKYGAVKSFTTSLIPVESVSLDRIDYTFHIIGNSITLNATVLPADATDKSIEWSSDKEDVATVDSSGEVTAKGNGKATITVKTKDQGRTATCEVTVAQWVTSISLDKTSLPIEIGNIATLSVISILPDNASDKSYTWSSSDNAIASVDNDGRVKANSKGSVTITATANDGSEVSASCSVDVYRIDVPQAIDMGIVVNGKNIKWASCNLGASSPEEYGVYYAWGETEPKSEYSWLTYKWYNASYDSLTKYNINSFYGTVDDKTKLDPEDDVAYVKLDGKWRMPTDAEWKALQSQCTWTRKALNGIYGQLVTAKNGNSIFLPYAGLRYGTSVYDTGSCGGYWSSSLFWDNPNYAFYVYIGSGSFGEGYDEYGRILGFSVRPVLE